MSTYGAVAFTTSLTVSPHKKSALLHAIGHAIGGDRFIPYDFKKKNGFLHSNQRAAALGLYRQIYCGCEYSIRHKEPYRAILFGMGYRGRVYAQWALEHPNDLQIVAFAEPDEKVRATWAEKLDLPAEAAVADWRDLLNLEGAEIALITLPDRLHFEAAMATLSKGYHLLLEKPMGATWEECVQIHAAVNQTQRLVWLGHILRFTPYYRKIAELCHSGELGEIVSISHLEPVGYRKAAHTFCRGPFGDTRQTTPMILQKCSHDFDLFAWWIGRPCQYVQSFGSCAHFNRAHAPQGSATRCLDCPAAIEATCPYSAIKLLRDASDLRYALPDSSQNGIEKALRGPYGRCIYQCQNDAVDHQVVNLLFENGVTVQHTMESYTWGRDRMTRIFLTHGEIIGDARHLTIHRFDTRTTTFWDAALEDGNAQHESSYWLGNDGIMRSFIDALRTLPPDQYANAFHKSIQSHLMAFAAEYSRLHGGVSIPIATL
jgi:predicted dehydrogenase